MKRLNEKDATMTSTTSRRAFMKYAAAMGAALVLPAGVAVAHETGETTPATAPMPALSPDEACDRLQWTNERATRLFRDDMAILDGRTQQEFAEMVSDANWLARKIELRDAFQSALDNEAVYGARIHAQWMIWAIECRAAGYAPEECFIDFPVIDGKRVTCVPMRNCGAWQA